MNQPQPYHNQPRPNRTAALLALPLLAATTALAANDFDAGAPFEEGARCLFIGHSFFVPIAIAFDDVAAQNSFPLHRMDTVFRGGPAGSPQAMWDDVAARAEVEALLATGDVELFGLTSFSSDNSDVSDYSRWIDLALQYNPDTRFFVGNPWVAGGPSLNTQTFDDANETTAYNTFNVIDQLRAAYPGEQIEYVSYGKTASIMKGMFELGELPDISGLTPDPTNGVPASEALFADPLMGHGGPMMVELAALSWMDALYGATIETLAFTQYQTDVTPIVAEVLAFNARVQTSCLADLVAPFGVVDLSDVDAFITAFDAGDSAADIAAPFGVIDLDDVDAFITVFAAGCP